MACCADRERDGERRDNALAEILLESTAALAACGEATGPAVSRGGPMPRCGEPTRRSRAASMCCCIGWSAWSTHNATAQATPQ